MKLKLKKLKKLFKLQKKINSSSLQDIILVKGKEHTAIPLQDIADWQEVGLNNTKFFETWLSGDLNPKKQKKE